MPTISETTYYLVKLYAYNHEAIFGVLNEEHQFELNGVGQIAADEWQRSAQAYANLSLDKWVVCSDRLEGIVSLRETSRSRNFNNYSSKPHMLTAFVASYKAAAAKRINLLRNSPGSPLWQRGYQERYIPDTTILKRVQQALVVSR